MSQRASGYARKPDDAYFTPAWAVDAVWKFLPAGITSIWDPAAGNGSMTSVFASWPGVERVVGTDLRDGVDFLSPELAGPSVDLIATNPPYSLAVEFIERALELAPVVAMLLRTDFNHARTRQHLFAHCPKYARKVVLTSRVRWFANTTGAPSFNHAWFIWDSGHIGFPTERFHIREKSPLRETLEAVAS